MIVVCRTEYVLHGCVLKKVNVAFLYTTEDVQDLPPVVTFNKHRLEVTSPIATNPAKALAEIFRPVLKRGLNLGLLVVLHANVPLVEI